MSVTLTPQALMLDIESCDRCASCPGCGLNRTRPRARGGGGNRRALGRDSGKDPVAQTTLAVPGKDLPDGDIPGT